MVSFGTGVGRKARIERLPLMTPSTMRVISD